MLLPVTTVPCFDVAVLESDFFVVNGFNMGRIIIGIIEIHVHSQLGFEELSLSLEKVWICFSLEALNLAIGI